MVGGGLIRSWGGWLAVKAMRRLGIVEKSDERILYNGYFVESVLDQADEKLKHQFTSVDLIDRVVRLIDKICRENLLSISGSRISEVPRLRSELAETLVRG